MSARLFLIAAALLLSGCVTITVHALPAPAPADECITDSECEGVE